MAARTQHVTTDHEEIRRWAQERGGHPAAVKATEGQRGAGDAGILRIDFPGYSGAEALEEISWEDWGRKFDEAKLAFVYQEETAGGAKSNFNKLVGRGTRAVRLRPPVRRKAKASAVKARPRKSLAKATAAKARPRKSPAKATATKRPAATRGKKAPAARRTLRARPATTSSAKRGTVAKKRTTTSKKTTPRRTPRAKPARTSRW